MKWIIILILLSSTVLAICPYDPICPDFNYETSDLSKINDWSKVDWTKIPPERIHEVPINEIVYSKLNPEQRKKMTTEQIQGNLDQIDNLRDVDVSRAKEAIKLAYGLTVGSLDGAARFDGKFLTATEGLGHFIDSADANLHKGRVDVNEDGTITFHPDGNMKSFPKEGKFEIDTNQKTVDIGTNTLKGIVSMDGGKTLVGVTSTTTTINGVKISSFNEKPVEIFFDGKEHTGNYVSFGKKNVIINQNDLTSNRYVFLQGNPYIDVKEKSGVHFRFKSGKVTVENRDNLPPKVKIINEKNFEFRNGKHLFFLSNNRIHFTSVGDDKSSVLVLHWHDINGKNFLGKDKKVFFDSNNNYAIFDNSLYPDEYLSYLEESLAEGGLVYNQVQGRLRKKGYNIRGGTVRDLQNIERIIDELPPKLRKQAKDIRILSPEELAKRCSKNANACASRMGRTYFKSSTITPRIVTHELAHQLSFPSDPNRGYESKAYLEYRRSLGSNYAVGYDSSTQEYRVFLKSNGVAYPANDLHQQQKQKLIELFKRGISHERQFRIMATQDDPGVYRYEVENPPPKSERTAWPDGTVGPNFGCTRAYGCVNAQEDIATHTECSIQESCWRPLLKSNYKYNRLHRKKFTFLCREGYIKRSTCTQMEVLY